jgi:hypothetical protein
MTDALHERLEMLEAEREALRSELADVSRVLRAFAESLPRHHDGCLCEVCQVRRNAIAAADSYLP